MKLYRSSTRFSATALALVMLGTAAILVLPGMGTAVASPINPSAVPYGLAYRMGALYIADPGENVIRKLNLSTGVETIVAGVPGSPAFSGDGGLATSVSLCSPDSPAFDAAGNLYFGESGVNRIRKVNASTGIISTVAGRSTNCGFNTGTFSGDGGPAKLADLDSPRGIAFDSNGNLLITDTYNHRIRKVTKSTGIISTVAGSGPYGYCCNGSYSGDGGPAVVAHLYQPQGIFVDEVGNVVFADNYNNRIRVISPGGIITTEAGRTPLPYGYCDPYTDGQPAAAAVLCGPAAMTYKAGVTYFTDYYNNRVRKITLGKTVKNIAGSGPSWPSAGGYSGDGGPATSAVLNYPDGLAVDDNGVLYIADTNNHVIRRLRANGIISTVPGFGSAG